MNRAARLHKPIVRRLRSLAALIGLSGFVGALVGVGMTIAGLGPAVLLWSLLAFSLGLGTLVLLAPGRAKLAPIEAEQAVLAEATAHRKLEDTVPEVASGSGNSVLVHEASQRAAAERIERAKKMARSREVRAAAPRENQPDSILLREVRAQAALAHSAPESALTTPTPATSAQNTPAAGQKLSELGVVGDTSQGMPDLDQVLRRRRIVG